MIPIHVYEIAALRYVRLLVSPNILPCFKLLDISLYNCNLAIIFTFACFLPAVKLFVVQVGNYLLVLWNNTMIGMLDSWNSKALLKYLGVKHNGQGL